MLNRKIIVVRGTYHDYDDAEIITLPHLAAGEKIANMTRAMFRKIKFFFYSLGITLAMIFLVKSSKYRIFEELHYRDLIDGMKKE